MSVSLPLATLRVEPELPAPRAFGRTPEDLAIDFEHPDRAALAAGIVAQCCVDEAVPHASRVEAAWALCVSDRIARLLKILQLTTTADALSVTARCPVDGCRQPLELTLPFAALLAMRETEDTGRIVYFPLGDAAPLAFRVPTGRDQVAWRSRSYESESDAFAAIVCTLAVESDTVPPLPPDKLLPLARAMEAADPLVAFAARTTCPHCQRSADIAVDLEAAAFRQLANVRRRMVRDIHELATHYGWSEAEILAVPPARRAEYQRMIAAESTSLP